MIKFIFQSNLLIRMLIRTKLASFNDALELCDYYALILISVKSWVDTRATVRLEGVGQLKYPIIASGQCSNQPRYPNCGTLVTELSIWIQWHGVSYFWDMKRNLTHFSWNPSPNTWYTLGVRNVGVFTPPFLSRLFCRHNHGASNYSLSHFSWRYLQSMFVHAKILIRILLRYC
jgi:hypothetical protein